MRILYLAGVDLSLPQGNAVHVRRLAQGLESAGQTVRLLTPVPSADTGWAGPSGGWTRVRGMSLPRLRHVTRELRISAGARSENARFAPDVRLIRQELFCFSPLLLSGSSAARGRRMQPGAGGRRAVPLVLEIHASHGDLTLGRSGRMRADCARALEGLALRRADAVAAVTEPLAEALINMHRLDPRRVHVIPNGAWIPPLPGRGATGTVDELLRFREALGAGERDFVIAFAGNLNHVQDLGVVLDAASELRELPLRFWIAGAGAGRAGLEDHAHSLGLSDRVRFFGGLPEEEAARLVLAAQAAVVPYRAPLYEALGGDSEALKLLQGLACDRPLLVTKARGLDLVERLGAGEQVASGDAGEWAAALRRWVTRWEESGRPLRDWPWPEGEGPGRRYVASARTWDHCAAAWIALLDRVTSSVR